MTIQMTATELKTHILAVLDRVAAGEEVEITKHGHTIARLLPARPVVHVARVYGSSRHEGA